MTQTKEAAVLFENVSKTFPNKQHVVVAVDGLTLRINRGEIFSLVGPDGAGKTTSIRMMCGVLPPTDGLVSILGLDFKTNRTEIKHRIGYLSQRFSLYGDLTIDENIDFFAEIHKLTDFKKRKEELLEFTRLTPFRSRLADRLSGGMKQKLALVCTLIHTPDIIFLDEPTTGVDPVSRRDFWRILSAVLKTGVTIVMSTPYLDEAERSTRVALLHQGKLLECDTPERVKASFPYRIVEILCSNPRKAISVLRESKSLNRAELFGDRIHAIFGKSSRSLEAVIKELRKANITVSSANVVAASLEDVFIHRTTASP
ncbi:MAG TPA: ABC transporter ATP-binding protein [Bacteroidota bacterium]|nr:ABC transporter ATP-binding protein [Bacteroidota bacterium]